LSFFVACLALFAHVPLVWQSELKLLYRDLDLKKRPLGCPQMNWGRTLKSHFGVMTFQPSLSNGARFPLIEIIGVLFAVLKRRVLQKKDTDLLPKRHLG
jgi:hypothetical protein